MNLAQSLYEAYFNKAGGLTYDHKPMPQWEQLGEEVQSRWQASAERALRLLPETFHPRHVERQDVIAFHQRFGVPTASEPSFLNPEAYQFRLKFMQEELDEFMLSHSSGDMHGAADALVDLAYVVHGTAHMMGLPWPRLWAEVQRANMDKVRATDATQSKRGTSLDVVKPDGWKGPDHSPALGNGPWPVLNGESA